MYRHERVVKKNAFFSSVVLSVDTWDGGGGPGEGREANPGPP